MAITERIKDAYYRVCVDADKNIFDRMAFWTRASQVELTVGDTGEKTNLQQTVGAIKGITSDRNVEEKGYALDAVFASESCHIEEFTVKASPEPGEVGWEDCPEGSAFGYIYKAVFTCPKNSRGEDMYYPETSPDWCLKSVGKFPTQEEKNMNNIIDILEIVKNDDNVTQLIFYSSDLPTTDVTLQVKGV